MKRFGTKTALKFILILIVGFLFLTLFILTFPTSSIDLKFSSEIQEHQNPLLHVFMKAISWFGNRWQSISIVLFAAALLRVYKFKREAIFCLLSLVIGIITYSIKIFINRPRPDKNLVNVIIDANSLSFPSGHTSFYVVFFGLISFFIYHHQWFKKTYRLTIIGALMALIFLVPISRIYLGAHWFTDVLGGFLIGLAYLGLLLTCYLKKDST